MVKTFQAILSKSIYCELFRKRCCRSIHAFLKCSCVQAFPYAKMKQIKEVKNGNVEMPNQATVVHKFRCFSCKTEFKYFFFFFFSAYIKHCLISTGTKCTWKQWLHFSICFLLNASSAPTFFLRPTHNMVCVGVRVFSLSLLFSLFLHRLVSVFFFFLFCETMTIQCDSRAFVLDFSSFSFSPFLFVLCVFLAHLQHNTTRRVQNLNNLYLLSWA